MRGFHKIVVVIIDRIAAPVKREPAFFVMTVLVYCHTAMAYLFNIGRGITLQDFPWHFFELCHGVFIAYVLTFLLSIVHRRWMKVTMYGLNTILLLLVVFCKYNFGMSISPFMVQLVMDTNVAEVSGFFHTFAFSYESIRAYFVVATYVALAFVFERVFARLQISDSLERIGRTLLTLTLLLGIVRGGVVFLNIVKLRDNIDYLKYVQSPMLSSYNFFSQLFCSIYYVCVIEGRQLQTLLNHTLSLSSTDVSLDKSIAGDSLNIVFILGESYIKKHAGIYGYPLQTTPRMEKEKKAGNLFAFNDVITPYNGTIATVRNVFSCNDINRHEQWYDFPWFPYLFYLAGYTVHHWDNQNADKSKSPSKYGFEDLQVYKLSPSKMGNCYESSNTTVYSYDGEMIDAFIYSHPAMSAHNLFIFHLWGQHNAPQDRFPKSRIHFTASDYVFRTEPWLTNEKREWIAAYDNSTLYNDSVFGQIIDWLGNQNTIIVYHPDHGEEVYDYRDMRGRKFIEDLYGRDFRHCQYDIPFIIWFSDRYLHTHPGIIDTMGQALDRPFMIDNTCQVLFHLGGIKTSYYHEERDPLSIRFIPVERYMDVVGTDYLYNYDEIVR